ncbi:uncharacterized protein LOC106874885 [Octopus bimaculoides]|uniref:Structure-specific endonuclease subunit SLX4 n=1 Tax=Octopus bimaculoides TaxID=37653 RepID=A0A0L8GTK8_OCTBM|nr:uncharacterized protein LOC106874885 [Octopus bimaculoides]|eukprot:XP_014778280.1 PREDICTED: uncharacterized protein LOC106874885 [Octopus bimaculoides]
MVGVRRTPKSSKKITKETKEVTPPKKLCKDTENEKQTECLFLKPEVNFNDSIDFKTPERKIGTGRSRLRNQIDYVRLNDPHKKEYSLIRKNTKQNISTNTSLESVSVTHSESSKKRARKSSQTKNEDSHLQNVTPSPKPEKIHLSQPKSVKSSSKQLKETKNKVNSKSKTPDFDKKFLEEKSLCNTLNQQIPKSRLPKNQNLSELVQSSDNNASFSGLTIYKSPSDPLEIVKKGNSSFTSGEQSEISNSCGTYLRNRRKISYKFNIKESRKYVPAVTSSHVPSITSSHVSSVTSSHVPTETSSYVSAVTSLYVPIGTSSNVPSATFSYVPSVTSSHVSSVTSSHVSTEASSHVPSVTSSHVLSVTSSHDPSVTSSHDPSVTSSRIPSVTSSHVPSVASSHVPSLHVSNGTSSHVFSLTSSHVPTEADSHFSTATSPLVYAITSPIASTETGFDHQQNKLELDNDFTEVQMKICPACEDDFPLLLFEEHVLQCLKEQFQSSSHKPFDNKTKHSQISQDEILAQKLHEELNENALTTNDSLESDKIMCCICKTDLTCLNSLHRTQHINTCIDQTENTKAPPDTVTESVVICPMCGLQFKSFSLRELHFKSCGRDKFIAPGQHIVTNVHGEPSRLTTNKRQSKNRKTSKSKKAPDDQLELALAMSNSLQEEQNKQEEQLSRCIQNIKKEVLKELKNQKNKQLPLLVRLSDEERQECNAEKVANIMNENFENVSLSKRHKHSSLAPTEPTNLWLKSSLTQADSSKLPFYVNSLMPPIEMDVVSVENRLKCLSRNTESVINQNTTDSADKENDQQPVAPSQTALILAELAGDNEPANDSMHTPVEDESPNVQKEMNEECSTGLLTSLSSDFCQLVNNSSFSDVQFMTADGTKIFGHKIILQIRCPNILNRISTHLETPIVHLSEISHDLLIVFLKYIYAGQLNIDETQAHNLKMLSQEFEMPELFHACEKMLKTSVNHNQQSSGFYPSPLKTVDDMIDYLLESSDEDVENRNICPENPSCDYKILDIEKQPQDSQNDNQSTVTRDSAEFQNSTNTSPNVISPSSKVLGNSLNGYSGDNGSNLDYLSNVPVSSELGTSAQLPEINCDNQPNKPQSNYNIDHLSTDKTDNPCDTVMTLQKSPSDLTSSQNTPHSPETDKGFELNKNVLPSFTSTLPVSTNLTDNSNNNSENKEQCQLDNAELIKDFSPIPFEDESFNNSLETKSYCDDITTPEKDNIHYNRENVLSLSDDLSNMSKELFSDHELETVENNKTSIQNSFDNQQEFTSSHQIVENISPCHKENKPDISNYNFSSHENVFLIKDSDEINNSPNVDNTVADDPVCRIIYTSQSLASNDGSNKELTVPLSLSTETNCNLGEKFCFLNSSAPVFPKTQEVKDINKNLNEDQPETFSQNQNRKRKQSSLSSSPLNRKKTKKELETEENSHLTLYNRSSPILNSDNSKLETSKEEPFSPINSLNSSVNLCNDNGSNKVYTVNSETSITIVVNDSYENTHQYKNESDLDISKETYSDISEINNLQISPKQPNDTESNRESIESASPEKNSNYENDREIYEESFTADDMNETTYGKAHFSVLNSFIQDNPDLYKKILEYEPLDFDVLKKRLGESKIKCSNKKLLEYLENQCITFILNKDKRSRKSCSPQKRKTVKEKLNTEASSNLETMAKVEELSEKCSLNSSFNNISDDLYNYEDGKTKQFDDDVTNEEERADLKKLSPNVSNDFCSAKEYQMETSEKPKKKFVFKKITAKSSICSSAGNKTVDTGTSDCLVKSFTEPSASDKKITNNENLQLNHNATNDVWEHFCDDSLVAFSPIPSHSRVNLDSSKDKLDLSPVAEQNLAHSSSHDCSYTSIIEDVKQMSCLGSELNCSLSDSFENIDLKPNPNAKFETPANVNHQTNCGEKEQSILSPFTPMPDYDKMSTPGLKKEMKKYGCKARPKKNMIKVLKDIFIRTHQYKSDSEQDTSMDTNNEISETNRFQISSPEPKNPQTDKESAESISPINISSFENDGVVIYEENYIANETEEVTSSQQTNGEILFSKVNDFIQTNPDFYRKVLMYEPLDFDVLKKTLEESNIKCPANKLLEYLDNQCITFALSKDKQSKRKPHRGGTGRPRKGKKV